MTRPDYAAAYLTALLDCEERTTAALGAYRAGGPALALREAIEAATTCLLVAVGDLYDQEHPPAPPLEVPADLPISRSSETEAVVAWIKSRGLPCTVVGQWAWVPAFAAPVAQWNDLMRKAGFLYSDKRESWFHPCGVQAKGTIRGSLARAHGVSSAERFSAGEHDTRPGWVVSKELRRTARNKARRVKR